MLLNALNIDIDEYNEIMHHMNDNDPPVFFFYRKKYKKNEYIKIKNSVFRIVM